jgi:2,5-dioxopentanoate dehydrogenase
MAIFEDTPLPEIDEVLQMAWKAFHQYRNLTIRQRADFMRAIAAGLENSDDALIATAMQETNLQEARLRNEKGPTVFQLTS